MSDFAFFGLCCIDILVYVKEYPKEDIDQRALFQKWARGGNASNNCTVFAMLLRNLEIKKAIQAFSDNFCMPKIHYFGALADDFWAKFMREDFIKEEICIEACEIFKGYSSPMATCIINVIKGSRSILSFTAEPMDMTSNAIKNFDLSKLKWIHFEGRNVDNVLKMIEYIRENDTKRQITISVDLEKNKPNVDKLLNADIDVFIIEKEFGRLFELTSPEQMMNEMPSKITNHNALLAMPWGNLGAYGYNMRKKQNCFSKCYLPSGCEVLDTLGAGDSFTGAIIFGLGMLQYDLQQALEFACRVAGAKCGQPGFHHLQSSIDLLAE